MANAKKNQKVAATEVAAATTTQPVAEVVDSATDSNPTAGVEVAVAEIVTEAVAEAKKRERSYSQSAIDTADLERLNQLKTFVKEKLKVSVSNQRIIRAALDLLGDNVEGFLKSIADDVNSKQLEKERKAYGVLKAKFEAAEAATFAEIKAQLDESQASTAEAA